MTVVIRNAQGDIKTFMEQDAGTVLETGETIEEIATPFTQYAHRLRLLVDGRGGELVKARAGIGTVIVQVECPGQESVQININGMVESVPLTDGLGAVTLSCETAGTFVLAPVDRKTYCAAGEAVCVVEVEE
ncbi:hypothetical protein [Leptolinea tardivitalis]|uniref:Uncharacterized protein n=1 Tax=Leptolinea tardivitalis TaxID=229920 RepID=A0A0P6WWX9_9CHLR|nr:hypothetical protein [Leptolinea tardivitalis]KPL70627.1 hypothetical protein ADM99_16125 [Leptolinea tardivitalis]GAP22248.1 hypothetical protein LTAR_02473 [Leptolinea tardivitalis]